MGNSTSNPSTAQRPPPPPPPPPRSRPLKNKKRSIVDHPALLAPVPLPATQRHHKHPPVSSPIPIPSPSQAQAPSPRPPPPANDSFAAPPDLLALPEHSTHRPIQYNSTRSFGAVRRGGPQGGGWAQEQTATPRPAPPFMPEVVRSSIPLRIPQAEPREDEGEGGENEGLVPVSVVWPSGGKDVLIAGTFDPLEWRARQRLRFDSNTSTHTTTLFLPPGTYRLKFIVDDAWRCADAMPTATDDDTGNLVNYIDVQHPSPSPSPATDERQSREARVMKANRRRTYLPIHPPLLPSFWDDADADTELAAGWGRGRDGALEKWTSVIPAPLVAAAQQEEAYGVAVQARRRSVGGGPPSVPGAPRLPRHLDKVILNTHVRSAGGGSAGGKSGGRRSRSGLGMTSLAAGEALEKSRSAAAMEQWAPADDSSVLPVPSHVVLHHLGTSAIKNGVLAVSDTTRYNQKYITTIYYKPT